MPVPTSYACSNLSSFLRMRVGSHRNAKNLDPALPTLLKDFTNFLYIHPFHLFLCDVLILANLVYALKMFTQFISFVWILNQSSHPHEMHNSHHITALHLCLFSYFLL
jgi:hypothetical protein